MDRKKIISSLLLLQKCRLWVYPFTSFIHLFTRKYNTLRVKGIFCRSVSFPYAVLKRTNIFQYLPEFETFLLEVSNVFKSNCASFLKAQLVNVIIGSIAPPRADISSAGFRLIGYQSNQPPSNFLPLTSCSLNRYYIKYIFICIQQYLGKFIWILDFVGGIYKVLVRAMLLQFIVEIF